MLTKYTLTIGSTEHVIPDECLKNWDEISFTLKRTDYSGVMRSYSTEFQFVGSVKDMLWELYLADGFLASASVAVYTITDTHTWEKQFESPLDFSTIELDGEVLSINALDNALASMLKSKKSQKYEFPVEDFETEEILIHRILLKNMAMFTFDFSDTDQPLGQVNLTFEERQSVIISEEYLSMCDEVNDTHAGDKSVNRFFATCNKYGASLTCAVKGVVRCYLSPSHFNLGVADTVPVQRMELVVLTVDSQDQNVEHVENILFYDDILHNTVNGVQYNTLINGTFSNGFDTFHDMEVYIENNHVTLRDGMFGIVGTGEYGYQQYWSNNVYEYQGGHWLAKGSAGSYYQDRTISATYTIVAADSMHVIHLPKDANVELRVASTNDTVGKMRFMYGSMETNWEDPLEKVVEVRGISPEELITKVVRSITGEDTEVSVAEDDGGLLEDTWLVPAEELRRIDNPKIYTTFGNFVDWIEAVFGYTYRVSGDALEFVHRSAVFVGSVHKTIESFSDADYTIADDLIYTEVDAGYSKKDYGEIDGRLETNFTNYYDTGYMLTDKKMQLVSKYRSDRYGVEFTARKAESESSTKDSSTDEDVFFIKTATTEDGLVYRPHYQLDFTPDVCVENNKAFIAVLGNGAAVTLKMTSSDGDNALEDVVIAAGSNLFTAGELEFTTDDMVLPTELNGLVQIDIEGYRVKGYIKEAEARYGKLNGVQYKLIVKEITAL